MEDLDQLAKLRNYILGRIEDSSELEAMEERLITDPVFFEQLTMAEEELIQDYVDGKLSADSAEVFENRFMVNEENRRRVRFARSLRSYVSKQTARQNEAPEGAGLWTNIKALFSSRIPIYASLVILALLAGLLVWINIPRTSEVDLALNRAFQNERLIGSRLSGLDYSPLKSVTRGNEDGRINKLELENAKLLALKAVREKSSAESLHALGKVYLAERDFKSAIQQFEKAVKLDPGFARLRNDLGAAYLEKALDLRDRKDEKEVPLEFFAKALEEIEKAVELDGKLLEAKFNRAVCLSNMRVPNQAKEAWEEYLRLDPNSKWGEEAKKRLEELEASKPVSKTKEQILQEFLMAKERGDDDRAWQILSRNREMITGKLIPQQLAFQFVDAKSAGDEAEAKKAFDGLVYAGDLEFKKVGDALWKDVANYYSGLPEAKRATISKAKEDLLQATELYNKGEYVASVGAFENAENGYRLAGNHAEAEIAMYWVVSSMFYAGRIDESATPNNNLTDVCSKKGYKWLLSHVYSRVGYLSRASKNRFSDALVYPQKSLKIASETGDSQGIRKFSTQIADEYKKLFRFEDSIQYFGRALTEAQGEPRWLDYDAVSGVFYERKLYRVAEIFEKEALINAEKQEAKIYTHVSNVNLGIILSAQKRFEQGKAFIKRGLEIANDFTDISTKEKSTAYSKLQLANLERKAGSLEESIVNYTDAIKFYDSSDFKLDTYEAYKGRLQSNVSLKRDGDVESDLAGILKLFKDYRSKILEEQSRNSFFDSEQSVYDIAIGYESDKGNFKQAFDYAEESRARSLLDLQDSAAKIEINENRPEVKFSQTGIEPKKLNQLQAEIPAGVQLLVYSVLTDKLIIWTLTKNSFTADKKEISSDILKEKSLAFFERVSTNGELSEIQRLSAELHELLISPVKEKLNPENEILIVPDKFLFRIPFAALYSEKYLIEDFTISYSPSVNVFLNCVKRAKEMPILKEEKLLAIGDPAFNREAYPDLEPLPSAKTEVEEIAKLYSDSKVLLGQQATKANMLKSLPEANVIHYAGHYVVDEKSPLLSRFVIAGDDELSNAELFSQELPNTRLIILSACDTGIEKYYEGEGMIGAARIFLAMGVPEVVGSLWKVDSEASEKLITSFNKEMKIEGLKTAYALKKAQLGGIRSEKYQNPYYWAAFSCL